MGDTSYPISGGGSLPEASGADQLLVSDGAGTDYTATDPATVRAVIGAAAASVVLYASDCTPEPGSESASVTGTGASSTFTLTASSTARTYGTAGATAARIVCPLPAGARVIEVEVGPLSATNLSGSGYRFLTVAHRNALDGAAPTQLYGCGISDNGTTYHNDLMGGANSGSRTFTPAHAITAADRWFRVTISPREPNLAFSSGAGTAGARPTAWAPIASPTTGIYSPYGTVGIADTDSITAIAIVLQSFGSGSASSITAGLRITVSM